MVTAVSRLEPLCAAASPPDGAAKAPQRTQAPPLTPDSPMIALAYRCLRRDVQASLDHQPQPGATPTPDDIHQIRIAARRLRVALRLFRPLLPQHGIGRLDKELRWFARALGAVRDLDVHAEELREHLQSADAGAAREFGAYELALRRERIAARDALHAVFAGDRYAALMARLGEYLDGAPSAGALRRWRSFTIRAGAARYLKRSRKRVVKLGKRLGDDASAEELHRLRIRVKRLRYTLEFFGEAYPALAPAAKAAKALQNVLGAHQDARTARRRVLAYTRALRKRSSSAAVPAEALGAWGSAQHRRAAQARRDFKLEWQRFLDAADLSDLDAR
jgi:triphosphatase